MYDEDSNRDSNLPNFETSHSRGTERTQGSRNQRISMLHQHGNSCKSNALSSLYRLEITFQNGHSLSYFYTEVLHKLASGSENSEKYFGVQDYNEAVK